MQKIGSIIDLSSFLNQRIRVKSHDREITGVRKAFDKIPNIVLDEAREVSYQNRELGVTIVRGQMITSILPEEVKQIPNPFNPQ